MQNFTKQQKRSINWYKEVRNSGKYRELLTGIGDRLDLHLSDYFHIFMNKTKRSYDKAQVYCKGVIMSNLNNIERISEEMNISYHQMQHFITESSWDFRQLLDQTSMEVSNLLPRFKLTGLILDETGWVKKGDKSVGVGHQYCGNVGKVSNSQVAVVGCLSNGDMASPIDARLYLPKSWCDSSERCEKAGIPKEHRVFKSKSEIALEMVRHQVELGISFDFVGGDGYYGHDVHLSEGIETLNLLYMLDIHCDQLIFTERPELELPARTSNRGRTPTRIKPTISGIRADHYMKSLAEDQWEFLTVRNTTKGVLTGEYHFRQVFIWEKDTNQILRRLLVIRRTISPSGEEQIKYSFTNAQLEQHTTECIAYMQAQRFFVEHCIKEAKQILGMDQYQTRKWLAWQHQISLNFLVASFILKEKLDCFESLPLLSARDIKELLVFKLYRQMDEEQMCDKIFNRHVRRQQDINNAYERQENEIC